jgi:hypothetical protein
MRKNYLLHLDITIPIDIMKHHLLKTNNYYKQESQLYMMNNRNLQKVIVYIFI